MCERKQLCLKCLLLILVTTAVIAVLYVVSYTVLSSRGIREAQQRNAPGFLYVGWEDVIKARNDGDESLRRILAIHQRRCILFAPIECLDRRVLGRPGSVSGGTWELYQSGDTDVEPRNKARDVDSSAIEVP